MWEHITPWTKGGLTVDEASCNTSKIREKLVKSAAQPLAQSPG